MKKWAFFIPIAVVIIIVFGFGKLYFVNFSFGAAGDDSAGYIFNAGRLFDGKSSVYRDEIVKMGLDHFEDPKLIEFLVPTHSHLIKSDGTITSKYSQGVSYLMALFAKISRNSTGFYYVNPFFAILNLVLVYLLVLAVFKNFKFKHWIGIFSVLILGLSYRYVDAAISQPMREMTFTFFILAATLIFFLAAQKRKFQWFFVAAPFFGIACLIRSTAIVSLPIFLIAAWSEFFPTKFNWNVVKILRDKIFWKFVKFAIIFCAISLVFLLPQFIDSFKVSREKDINAVYKSKIVALPDIDHLESLNIRSIFTSTGKFRPDEGGLKYYKTVIDKITPFPFFIFLVFLGAVSMLRERKNFQTQWPYAAAWIFLANIFTYLVLFSAWVNPYPRYILPIFPFLAILGASGIVYFLRIIIPMFFVKKSSRGFIIAAFVIALLLPYYGHYFTLKNYIIGLYEKTRAISKSDLNNLRDMGTKLNNKNAILIFSSDYANGLSETFEAHTGIRAIRPPYSNSQNLMPQQATEKFMKKLIEKKDVYLWLDHSSNARNNRLFVENFQLEKRFSYNFSFFDNQVFVYKLSNK